MNVVYTDVENPDILSFSVQNKSPSQALQIYALGIMVSTINGMLGYTLADALWEFNSLSCKALVCSAAFGFTIGFAYLQFFNIVVKNDEGCLLDSEDDCNWLDLCSQKKALDSMYQYKAVKLIADMLKSAILFGLYTLLGANFFGYVTTFVNVCFVASAAMLGASVTSLVVNCIWLGFSERRNFQERYRYMLGCAVDCGVSIQQGCCDFLSLFQYKRDALRQEQSLDFTQQHIRNYGYDRMMVLP